jgi:hypothetical protein
MDVAKDWTAKLGCDCLDEETVSALMLKHAAEASPRGLVLFSSRDPARVRRNVKAVLEPDFSPTQIATFGELVNRPQICVVLRISWRYGYRTLVV